MIMSLSRWTAYILVILLALRPDHSHAANLAPCLANVISCANNSTGPVCVSSINISNTTAFSILRTSAGSSLSIAPVSAEVATALSYSGCVEHCGANQEPFNWTVFSQDYAAWLLPYLALLSQLPFGARRRTDNLMSAVLTLGSPALAGYSIYMTLLNARWINDQLFADIDYPSAAVRHSVVRVLTKLQQVPVRVHPGDSARFESLVVHPDNDAWWTMLAEDLDYSRTWSIASATSITWVVIAYLLTVADSLSNAAEHMNSNGEGTGSVWLWLLPIVVGWLVLSPNDYTRVHDAYDKASRQVFVADSHDPTAAPTLLTSNFGLTIRPGLDWTLYERSVTSPDELRIPPIFNYARSLSWSRTAYLISLYYRTAWRKSGDRVGVDGNPIPGNVRNDVPRQSRLGNRDQIIRYCYPDDYDYPGHCIFWPRGVLLNMFVASLMALQLQWGTTVAAVLVVWFTPTVGFGCRSLAYMIYGTLSTVVWITLVLSSILGYYAHHLMDNPPASGSGSECDEQCTPSTPPTPPPPFKITPTPGIKCSGSTFSEGIDSIAPPSHEIQVHNGEGKEEDVRVNTEPVSLAPVKHPKGRRELVRVIARAADWLRWIGKSLAIINAIGIITNSVFQYANVYDNCYCDSSVYSWRSYAFAVLAPNASDVRLATSAWIGALALALGSCALFVGTIYLIRDSFPS